jgi:hypothetical protein
MKKDRRIIVTNIIGDIDNYKEAFLDYCKINGLDPEEEDIYEFANEESGIWLDDEKSNLDIPCGRILVIASLGLWDGKHSAYKVINAKSVRNIFKEAQDDFTFYCDRYNVCAEIIHHDGTNVLEFREITNEGSALERLKEALYNQKEVTREMIRRCTRSLRPKVAAVYGF